MKIFSSNVGNIFFLLTIAGTREGSRFGVVNFGYGPKSPDSYKNSFGSVTLELTYLNKGTTDHLENGEDGGGRVKMKRKTIVYQVIGVELY